MIIVVSVIISGLSQSGKSKSGADSIEWLGGETMNLKNNKITVGELLDYAPAKAVFQKKFPMVMRHPMLGAARTVTLEQLIAFAGAYIPKKTVEDTLNELRKV